MSIKKLLSSMIIMLTVTGVMMPQSVTLTMSYYKQEITPVLPKLLNAFTAKYPNIKITTEIHPNDGGASLAAAAASGKLPDIMQQPAYSAVIENAKNGYIIDLTNQGVIKKVIDGAKPSVTYKGKIYALPMDFAGLGIIYNKTIFKKYGLKAPSTYLELQKVAETLKKNNVVPFAGLLKENWSIGHFMMMLHGSMLANKLGVNGVASFVDDMNAGKTSWDKDVNISKIFEIMDWYKGNMEPNAFEMAWNEQQAEFANEKAAMMVQGLWSYLPAITTNPKLDCGFIPFPWSNKAGDNKFFADVDSTFTVSSQSPKERQDAALKFLDWLSSPEAIKVWTNDIKLTSTFKGAEIKSMQMPFQDLMNDVNKNGSYPWEFSMCPTPTWEQAMKNGALGFALGKEKPADVVKEINESWKTNFKP
jgi:raffinose/stachyose/melibiose transport system substrate-binding protein